MVGDKRLFEYAYQTPTDDYHDVTTLLMCSKVS